MESFARFKVEAIHGEKFQTRNELGFEVFDYIERFYDKRRKHSTLECLSPNLYEGRYLEAFCA
ncbi:MAG: IS3 family transposase [Bdellovibrionales bacterium]|nr:IS3 family transposase [Bdellovibrionales bacterium]